MHCAHVQSHISFTSPLSHQVCSDTYRSCISICHVLYKKFPGLVSISCIDFERLHWHGNADLQGASSFLGTDGSWMVQVSTVVDVVEFPSPRRSRDSRLQ
jgi:hypothetical protein